MKYVNYKDVLAFLSEEIISLEEELTGKYAIQYDYKSDNGLVLMTKYHVLLELRSAKARLIRKFGEPEK